MNPGVHAAPLRPHLRVRGRGGERRERRGESSGSRMPRGRCNDWMCERALERQAPCRPLKTSLPDFVITFLRANHLPGRAGKQGKEKWGMSRHVPVT